ncbi:MAG: hypothetical protein HY898_05525 [Deltaproteobacteria bacterium]|nr:hypothetical protein [Deltaproteobacteria bacterium]
MMPRALLAAFSSLLPACSGATEGRLVTFSAAAAGPADAVQGQPYELTSGRGYHVVLTRARLHIGAAYLNQSAPSAAAPSQPCELPGAYVAQILTGVDVDVLSPLPQPFGSPGSGIASHAVAAEIVLTGGDLNAIDDPTIILDVAGTASKQGTYYPFDGIVTIGRNRLQPSTDPAAPGAEPPCRRRIAAPVAVDITPADGGRLVVRVDPRGWFANVDFAQLRKVSDKPPQYRFDDNSETQPNLNLYTGLTSRDGVYGFTWEGP